MSREVDEFLMEAEFDGSKLESGARQSIKALEEFDKQVELVCKRVDGAPTVFEKFAGAMSRLNPIDPRNWIRAAGEAINGITEILVGFYRSIGSKVGDILGGWMGKLTSTVNSFVVTPVGRGFKKYEESVESVQKMMNATGLGIEEVTEQMDKLRWFTDETSYDFSAMASNIGTFTASGVDLKTATTAMIGIADAAGYYGVNAEKASHAMSGFSKALGSGAMLKQNWEWIHTAGLDTEGFKQSLIDAAVEIGTLNKSASGLVTTSKGTAVDIASFEGALSERWANDKVMLKALTYYGGATEEIYKEYLRLDGEEATSDIIERMAGSLDELGIKSLRASQETKSLSDALEYVRTAVASGWMRTWELIFGNYEEAKKIWTYLANNTLYDLFVAGGDERNAILEQWKEMFGRDSLIRSFQNLERAANNIIGPIGKAWDAIFPSSVENKAKWLVDLTHKFEEFTDKLADFFEPFEDAMTDAFGDFVDDASKVVREVTGIGEAAETVTAPIKDTAEAIEELARSVISGNWGKGEARRKALEEAGHSYEVIQNKVNELLGCAFRYEVAEEDQIESTEELAEANEELTDTFGTVANATAASNTRSNKLRRTFKGLFAILKIGKIIFGEIAGAVSELWGTIKELVVVPLFEWILGGTAKLGDSLVYFSQMAEKTGILKEHLKKLNGWIRETALPWLVEKVIEAKNSIVEFIGAIKESTPWKVITKNAEKLGKTLKSYGKKGIGKVVEWFSGKDSKVSEKKGLLGAVGTAKSKFAEFGSWIASNFPSFQKFFDLFTHKSVFETITNWAKETAIPKITEGFGKLKGSLISLYETVKNSDVWGRFTSSLGRLKDTLLELGKKGIEKVVGWFSNDDNKAMMQSSMANGIDWLLGKLSDFADWISDHAQNIEDFFGMIGGWISNQVGNLGEKFGDFNKDFQEFAKKIQDGYNKVMEVKGKIETWYNESNFKTITDGIMEAIGKLLAFLENPDWVRISEVFKNLGIGAIGYVIANFIRTLTGTVLAVPGTIYNILDNIRLALIAYQTDIKVNLIKSVAFSMLALAAAIFVMASVPEDRLHDAVSQLTMLMFVMALLVKAMASFRKASAAFLAGKISAEQVAKANEDGKKMKDTVIEGGKKASSVFAAGLKEFINGVNAGIQTLANGVSKAINKVAGRIGTALLFLGAGAGIWLLVDAVTKLVNLIKNEDPHVLKEAASWIMTALLFVEGCALAMAGLLRKAQNVNFKGSGALVVGLAIAVDLLIAAISYLTNQIITHEDEVHKAITSIGYLLGIMGIVTGAMLIIVGLLTAFTDTGFKIDKSSILHQIILFAEIAGFFVILAVSVNLMVPAIAALAAIKNEDLQSAIGALIGIGAFMVAMGTMAALMAKVDAKHLQTGVESLIKVAVSIIIMMAALELAGAKVENIQTGMQQMFAVLVTLGIVLGVLIGFTTLFKDGVTVFVDSMLKFAVGMLVIGAAMYVFNQALMLFPPAADALVKGLTNMGNGIIKNWKPIAVAIVAFIALFLAVKYLKVGEFISKLGEKVIGFVTKIPAAFSKLASSFTSLLEKIKAHGNEIKVVTTKLIVALVSGFAAASTTTGQKVIEFIMGFGSKILEALPQLLDMAWALIVKVVKYLSEKIPDIVQMLGAILINTVHALADFIQNNQDAMISAIQRVGGALYNLVLRMVGMILDGLASSLDKIWKDNIASQKMREWAENFNENWQLEIEPAVTASIEATYSTASETAEKGHKEFNDDLSSRIQQDADTIKKGGKETAAAAGDAGEGTVDNWTESIVAKLSASGMPADKIQEYLSALNQGDYTEENGLQTILGYANGIETGAPEVEHQTVVMVDSAGSILEGTEQEGKKSGENFARGFATGILENLRFVQSAATSMANVAKNTVSGKLQEHSPSRVAMWHGEMFGLGFANGIYETMDSTKEASLTMAESALKTMKNAISRVASSINDDLNTEPVIRPVLDTSAIQNGIGDANMMLNGLSYATTGNYGSLGTIRAYGSQSLSDSISKAIKDAVSGVSETLANSDTKTTIEVPLNIDGRRVAKATAEYTRNELARLDKYNSRKGGKV